MISDLPFLRSYNYIVHPTVWTSKGIIAPNHKMNAAFYLCTEQTFSPHSNCFLALDIHFSSEYKVFPRSPVASESLCTWHCRCQMYELQLSSCGQGQPIVRMYDYAYLEGRADHPGGMVPSRKPMALRVNGPVEWSQLNGPSCNSKQAKSPFIALHCISFPSPVLSMHLGNAIHSLKRSPGAPLIL